MARNSCLFVGPRRPGAEAHRESPLAKRPSCWPLINNWFWPKFAGAQWWEYWEEHGMWIYKSKILAQIWGWIYHYNETAAAGIICEYVSWYYLLWQQGCDPLHASRKVARRQNEPRQVPSWTTSPPRPSVRGMISIQGTAVHKKLWEIGSWQLCILQTVHFRLWVTVVRFSII